MDSDIAHETISSINGRKRKAEPEEPQDSIPDAAPSDSMLVDSITAFSNAPRRPPSAPAWFSRVSPGVGDGVWSPTDTPPVSPLTEVPEEAPRCQKRPRIEREQSPRPVKRLSRRHRFSETPSPTCPPSRFWHRSDIRDMGIVPTRDPGPISGSLYRLKDGHCAPGCNQHLLPSPLPPINLNSPHIPVPTPLINRQTLRELDLNTILRNPQLRHDLLFDSGLQFRPTSGRRKRELSDKYWSAVTQELKNGCTCVSFDTQGKPHECICVCRRVSSPPPNPVLAFSTARHVITLRMPSRVRPLLNELLDLLLCVIQPLSGISGYVSPATLQMQMQQHASQANQLRSIFDPELIEQEMKHDVFDPSGLFQTIGQVLKSHCAPMRDRAVEAMVDIAQTCAPGGSGTKVDAVRAIRMCLEILELMKLDIANHQLQTLRPFLIETSSQFELKAFRRRKGQEASVQLTKEWLQTAHRQLLASETLPHPSYASQSLSYSSLKRTMQTFICVLKGLTDLIFEPPSPISSSKSTLPPTSQSTLPSPTSLPGYPETTFLDSARLVVLGTDAADTVSMYLFLMLYRQLVFFDPNPQQSSSRTMPKVTESDLSQLKTEIKDIASCHLGYCFTQPPPKEGSETEKSEDKEWDKWRKAAQDVVLQIAMRATQAQNRAKAPSSSSDLPGLQPPSERMLKLAERWLDTNLRPGSALSNILRNRLRDAVFHRLLATTFPARDTATGKLKANSGINLSTSSLLPTPPSSSGTATGMESLTDEIRILTEKLSRLSQIHLGVYIPLYEQDGFLYS